MPAVLIGRQGKLPILVLLTRELALWLLYHKISPAAKPEEFQSYKTKTPCNWSQAAGSFVCIADRAGIPSTRRLHSNKKKIKGKDMFYETS